MPIWALGHILLHPNVGRRLACFRLMLLRFRTGSFMRHLFALRQTRQSTIGRVALHRSRNTVWAGRGSNRGGVNFRAKNRLLQLLSSELSYFTSDGCASRDLGLRVFLLWSNWLYGVSGRQLDRISFFKGLRVRDQCETGSWTQIDT
jgi:hypothetical protein